MGICGDLKVKKKSLAEQELNQSPQILILEHISFPVALWKKGSATLSVQATCCTITSYLKLGLLFVLSLPAQNKDKSYHQTQFQPCMNIKLEGYFLGISMLLSWHLIGSYYLHFSVVIKCNDCIFIFIYKGSCLYNKIWFNRLKTHLMDFWGPNACKQCSNQTSKQA